MPGAVKSKILRKDSSLKRKSCQRTRYLSIINEKENKRLKQSKGKCFLKLHLSSKLRVPIFTEAPKFYTRLSEL